MVYQCLANGIPQNTQQRITKDDKSLLVSPYTTLAFVQHTGVYIVLAKVEYSYKMTLNYIRNTLKVEHHRAQNKKKI